MNKLEQLATIKTSGLIGPALDWLVAKCNGDFALYHNIEEGQRFLNLWTDSAFLHYSSNWANGGPIIERERINLVSQGDAHDWVASRWDYEVSDWTGHTPGPTPLIAAVRCYVASKLGDVVEVPDELVQ